MKALFVELPPFEKYREGYMSDDEFNEFQKILLITPKAGDVIAGTGGLKASLKMHFSRNCCVSSVLESSYIQIYTPVLRAVLPCICKKITIFRGAFKKDSIL